MRATFLRQKCGFVYAFSVQLFHHHLKRSLALPNSLHFSASCSQSQGESKAQAHPVQQGAARRDGYTPALNIKFDSKTRG